MGYTVVCSRKYSNQNGITTRGDQEMEGSLIRGGRRNRIGISAEREGHDLRLWLRLV